MLQVYHQLHLYKEKSDSVNLNCSSVFKFEFKMIMLVCNIELYSKFQFKTKFRQDRLFHLG